MAINLIDKLRSDSAKIADRQNEVSNEIVNYFKDRINSVKFTKSIEEYCSREYILKDRKAVYSVEFWSYSSGCSDTNFRVGMFQWNNPEEPHGIKSGTYKGVALYDIQKTVGPILLKLLVSAFEQQGFRTVVTDNESWLQYYHKLVTIYW